jgi:hypothetical protein
MLRLVFLRDHARMQLMPRERLAAGMVVQTQSGGDDGAASGNGVAGRITVRVGRQASARTRLTVGRDGRASTATRCLPRAPVQGRPGLDRQAGRGRTLCQCLKQTMRVRRVDLAQRFDRPRRP